MARFQLLAMWMLAHQTLDERHQRLAWHDGRGEGDEVRAALTDQHEAWSALKTKEARRAAYARAIRDARTSTDFDARAQAQAMDAASMERLAS